jgi:hypothetical protein
MAITLSNFSLTISSDSQSIIGTPAIKAFGFNFSSQGYSPVDPQEKEKIKRLEMTIPDLEIQRGKRTIKYRRDITLANLLLYSIPRHAMTEA